MNALIERCRLAGIRLRVEGVDLYCDAPKGAMTEALAAELKAHKPDILAALAIPPLAPASAARRQKVLALLARDGGQYATLVEDPNADPVVMALATPDGTCEVRIPRDRYDPFAALAIVKEWEREDPDPPPSGGASPSPSPAAVPWRSIPPPATPCPSGQPTPSATTALGALSHRSRGSPSPLSGTGQPR